MKALKLFPRYILWHYTIALADLARLWKNSLWFLSHFFSLGILTRTFFKPWRRIEEGYTKGFNPGAFFSSLIINTIMRVVGMIMRMSVIVMGVVALGVDVVAGACLLIIWLVLPLITGALYVIGFITLFR